MEGFSTYSSRFLKLLSTSEKWKILKLLVLSIESIILGKYFQKVTKSSFVNTQTRSGTDTSKLVYRHCGKHHAKNRLRVPLEPSIIMLAYIFAEAVKF